MKMITAIVNKEDAKKASSELVKARFSVTKLATTGGFLSAGNMTLMMGVADDRVEECINVLRRCCSQHTEVMPGNAAFGSDIGSPAPVTITVGGAVVFVTNVERFEKL